MNIQDNQTSPAASRTGLWAWLLHGLSHGSSLPRSRRLALYFGVGTAALLVIWLPVGLFLAFKPLTFTSTWALILPGAGAGTAVSLESVGQASATVSSPYQSHSVDPKVNYKAIVESLPVLAAAAAELGMSAEDFGKPRIKLVDQTALMNFRVSGDSAEQAYRKSHALYKALQNELDRLRSDEEARREEAVGQMMRGFSDKLQQAQQRILDYQATARIVSMEQFTELTLNLERMRSSVRDLKGQHAGLNGRVQSLEKVLDVSPEKAAALLTLQQDPQFHQLAQELATATTVLTKNQARWGSKHNEVVGAREDVAGLRKALLTRARLLAPELQLDPSHLAAQGNVEASLYTRLIELAAERQGMADQIVTLEASIVDQENRLEQSTTDASNLEDLQRKHQVATAVFTTALAKVDIGKSDRFSSYPLVQLLARPVLPEKPDTLGRNLALLGALVGTVFSLFGLFLLWIRKPFLQKLLKNA